MSAFSHCTWCGAQLPASTTSNTTTITVSAGCTPCYQRVMHEAQERQAMHDDVRAMRRHAEDEAWRERMQALAAPLDIPYP